MGHIGISAAGRYFSQHRGRVVALTAGGFPLAEATLPLSAGLILAASHWRVPLLLATAVLLFLLLPALLALSRHAAHLAHLPEPRVLGEDDVSRKTVFTRAEVVRDPGFYCLLPAALVVPFAVTAVFFHQSAFPEARGWTAEQVGVGVTGFAVGHILGLVLAGPVVDRIGAQRSLSFGLLPIVASMLVLAFTHAAWTPVGYLMLCGLGLGCVGTASGALWPERYGTPHLGAIRAVAQSSMVVSTALSPVLIGVLLDIGVGVVRIAGLLAALALSGALLVALARTLAPTGDALNSQG